MLKNTFHKMRQKAMFLNQRNILSLLEQDESARLLDLGCNDGEWTLELAGIIQTKDIDGLDIVEERLREAAEKGIKTHFGNLNEDLPFEDNSFDCIHANQVIEHVQDLDHFTGEIYRILKPGGYTVISTENLASWCNIFALILGWQPFSATNISGTRLGVGNPFAINRGDEVQFRSWLHNHVMSSSALREVFEIHGFKVERLVGAGYFPFPAVFGKLDVRHSHFITLKARKG